MAFNTAFEDVSFLLVLFFPVTIGFGIGAVFFTRWQTRMSPALLRASLRGVAYVAVLVFAVAALAGFVFWSMGFKYVETAAGTPRWIDDALDVSSTVALITFTVTVLTCTIAAVSAGRSAFRRSPTAP